MKRFSMFLGCVALALTTTQIRANDYGNVNVQPVHFLGFLGEGGAGDCHAGGCHDGNGCQDGACTSCNGFTPICSACEPLWNIYVGAVILDRSNPNGLPVDLDWEPGVDVDVRRRMGDYQLQVRYFGVDDWSDSFEGALYSSNLHSTEVNLRRQWTDSLTLLGGFRWVEMGDEAADQFAFIDTNNHMYGGQVGAEWLVWDRGGPFTVTSGVKAGIYYNNTDVDAGIFGLTNSSSKSHTAFLGEWDILARYQLTDRWTLRAGYQLLWLEGVAGVDTAQIDAAFAQGTVSTSSSPFYHGAVIGAEFSF